MAQNHVYLSVQNEDYSTASRHLLKDDLTSPLPPKIVAVVGAGATNAACGLPTGEDAAKRLIEAFKARASVNGQLIAEEIHRITVEYRLERGDFEAVLLALSKFDQKTVLKELSTIYGRRHYPSLAYEILAHWLKHRFIDAIVSFNFDELLDQAIDDELGSHGYYRVISDGDCPEDVAHWLDNRGRFRFPLYIKPHGTASHKSTMRFTRSSYSLLPIELVNLLKRLFQAPTDVVIIGHAMQSVEFNDILASSGGDLLKFYAISLQKPEFRVADKPYWDVAFCDAGLNGGLGHSIDLVATTTAQMFSDTLRPRSIRRHRLISALFGRTAVVDEERHTRERLREDYLRDRVYVEISLAISKAKGFASLEHLARGRAGQYFRLLRRHAPSGVTKDSMLTMCTNLKLEPFGYSRDTLCLSGAKEAGRDRLRRPILPADEFRKAAGELALVTKDFLSPERQLRCLQNSDELFLAFLEMYEGEEVEVSTDTEATTNDVFANPVTLPTLTSLQVQTRKMMESESWDSILCTAESGEWLLKWSEQINKRDGRLAVVLADETYTTSLSNTFGERLGGRARWLPWWLHNRHVTVFLKDKKIVQAIFFERRLRTSHITPLLLEGADAEIAMDSFVAYWIKAEQYSRFSTEIEIRPRQVRSESELLIADMYKRPRA